jgi:hypothetical protein
MGSGIGGHQRTYQGRTNEWFTPKWIIDKLGQFDLDPCSSDRRPFDIAPRWFTKEDNGLSKEWLGMVFVNPPYGPETKLWLKKLKEYGNGIALVFALTETKMFFDHVWNDCSAILFIKKRVSFTDCTGDEGQSSNGGPSVLIAYGEQAAERLEKSGIEGKFINMKRKGLFEFKVKFL